MKHRDLKPDERAIWRKVARTARPMDPSRLASLTEPKHGVAKPDRARGKTPIVASRKATPLGPAHSSLHKQYADKPNPENRVPENRGPENRKHERRVRRGQIEIEARIDLHGMRQVEAHMAFKSFIRSTSGRGLKTVLVITGKGIRHSSRAREPGQSEPGVLRRVFTDWLSEPDIRPLVSGYASANRRHGGDGAFYVTLRSGA